MNTKCALFFSTLLSIPVVHAQSIYPTFTGSMQCADNVVVSITKDPHGKSEYQIGLGKAKYRAQQVTTASGAIKLEDKHNGIVWLQMSNKSMLFNEKHGKRLATDCQNEEQKVVQKSLDESAATVATSKP
ncbi:MAG: hypothetical protein QM533_01270 [Cytophagales bacterium]|nr:hypothetical protein [Cytophagales bacterium]